MEQNPNQKPQKPQKPLNAYARYSSLGMQMALIIAGGSYGGHKLDEHYGNRTPVFTIVLSLVSIAVALYLVLREVTKTKS